MKLTIRVGDYGAMHDCDPKAELVQFLDENGRVVFEVTPSGRSLEVRTTYHSLGIDPRAGNCITVSERKT